MIKTTATLLFSARLCGDVRTATTRQRHREPSGQKAKQSNEDKGLVGKAKVAGDEQEKKPTDLKAHSGFHRVISGDCSISLRQTASEY